MLFSEPIVLHSVRDDGRHWLTTLDFPPMQLLPVAANHCRVGHFLARVLSAKLASGDGMPNELVLTRADVTAGSSELAGEAGDVRVRFEMRSAPPDADDAEADADEEVSFVTPLPPSDWAGDYDAWIQAAGRRLGLDAPLARDADAYLSEMEAAAAEVQRRLPGLRQRFISGLGDATMGLKIGLPTRAGGTEFVWVVPLDWTAAGPVTCRLESEPHDCKGFQRGQTLAVAERDVVDYIIGSESGVIEPGLSDRIARNYGLMLS